MQTGRSRWPAQAARAAVAAVRLLGPVLIPSWRFFDGVGASPRLEYAIAEHAADEPAQWHTLPLNVANVSITQLLWRLVYNAARNDQLFLVSCCERVLEASSGEATQSQAARADSSVCAGAQREILLRVLLHARHAGLLPLRADLLALRSTTGYWLRFRILEVRRVETALHTELAFTSEAVGVAELTNHVPALRAMP